MRGVWIATDRGKLTLFKFPNNLAYSSKTSCSSGLRLSSPSDVCEAPKFCSAPLDAGAGSEAMVCYLCFLLFVLCTVGMELGWLCG